MSFVENVSLGFAEVRQPFAYLSIGGANVNIMECEVTQSGGGSYTSTFEAKIALDDPTSPGVQFWSTTTPMPCTIFASNGDGSGEAQLLTNGMVDKVEIEFGPRIVHITGRGAEAQLIDARHDQNYTNQTIGSVVSQIAGQFGLGAVINSPNAGSMAGST